MQLDSDINVLGSLQDWNLIRVFHTENIHTLQNKGGFHTFTTVKTEKSVKRFEKAIRATFLRCDNKDLALLLNQYLQSTIHSNEGLLLLFWNASYNNQLLSYLNLQVFFPAFYSGRVTIKNNEVIACITDLRHKEDALKKWTETTIKTTASKYLTLLKKFGLMEGSANKGIVHIHLSDAMFVLFAYWITAISDKPNLFQSVWMPYCFSERQSFIDRLLQKKFSKYFNVVYTGDKLSIEPLMPYELIYEHVTKS